LQIAASSEYKQVFFLLCLRNLSAAAGEEGRAECALGVIMKVPAQLGATSQAREITQLTNSTSETLNFREGTGIPNSFLKVEGGCGLTLPEVLQ